MTFGLVVTACPKLLVSPRIGFAHLYVIFSSFDYSDLWHLQQLTGTAAFIVITF